MSSNYGFVYLLRNECMPGIYKIGMTDRSPRQRCEELSASTSVPCPFEIVVAAEVESPRQVEKIMHELYGEFRVSENREFFRLSHDQAVMAIVDLVGHSQACNGVHCEIESADLWAEANKSVCAEVRGKIERMPF